jgi:hypothetical protein
MPPGGWSRYPARFLRYFPENGKKHLTEKQKIARIVYMNGLKWGLFYCLVFLAACGSQEGDIIRNKPPETSTPEAAPLVDSRPLQERDFDPNNPEQKEIVREEVQRFIGEINRIIQNRDFNAWKECLSDVYIRKITDPVYLKALSDTSPLLKRQRIVLKTLEDYFFYAVVPAVTKIKLESIDIEFTGDNTVKALKTDVNPVTRLYEVERLYNLEKSGNVWKIIN